MFRSFRLYIMFILVIGLSCKNSPTTSTTSTTPDTSTPWTQPVQIPALSEFDAQFTVIGTEMTIEGRIRTSSTALFNSVLAANTGVTTVILENVPGTLDTDASFAIGRAIRSNGLATVVPVGGFVASEGTDIFLAGATRMINGPNTTKLAGLIAVHSWEAGFTRGSDLPTSSPLHQPFLTYYSDIGIADSFYWFAINAAAPDSFHVMTTAEISQHGVVTTTTSKVTGW